MHGICRYAWLFLSGERIVAYGPLVVKSALVAELFLFHRVWCLIGLFVHSYLALRTHHLGKREFIDSFLAVDVSICLLFL